MRRHEVQEARAIFADHLLETLGISNFRAFTDDEAVEYWREVWLPRQQALTKS